jgi:formiminoglutamate deiminase
VWSCGRQASPPERKEAALPETTFHAEYAWLGGDRAARDVAINVRGGRIVDVRPGVPATHLAGAWRLTGLVLPGLVNTHSHALHRALRGRVESGATDFWQWRARMYAVAERLDPDLLFRLARATYAEMALAGITTVGEFHYLHHAPGGRRYADPAVMSTALVAAATEVGIRLTLLDTCYLQGDVDGAPLSGVQRRFGDGSWEAWAERASRLQAGPLVLPGAAIHSVRAVPRQALAPTAEFAGRTGRPLHVHLSEQPAENVACRRAYGMSPTELLADAGVLTGAATAVHATHVSESDVAALGSAGTCVSMCVTTERDLADGIGPARALADAGSPIAVGSDGHSVIDLFEEARGVEMDERLRTGARGHFSSAELASALTGNGARSLGWDAGRLEAGGLADLVSVNLDSARTAGARVDDPLAPALFTATAADVDTVVVGGEVIVASGCHRHLDVPAELGAAIAAVLS